MCIEGNYLNRFISQIGIMFKPIAVFAILVAFVFHLGACPCGCIEHNAWLQVLHAADEDSSQSGNDSRCEIAGDHEHDCAGSRPQFLDTAQHPECVKQLLMFSIVSQSPLVGGDSRASRLECADAPHRISAPPRAELQVFLL